MPKLIVSKNNAYKEYSGYIVSSEIRNEYNAVTINPPFFKTIIIIDTDVNNYDMKRIYNMCLINGKIYFPKTYKKFFSEFVTVEKTKYESFYSCTKPNNKIFIFRNKRSVDFIILGVQRAGTTSLSYNLSKHPDIYINRDQDPRKSEIHFFDLNWFQGINWYKEKFNHNYPLMGEKTPDLLNIESTFPLIQRVNPYVKLIIILKDPILRAYSAWKMISKYFDETRSFEECIKQEKIIKNITFHTVKNQYLQRGLYYQQIKKLRRWFPDQNILILISDDVEKNPEQEYNKIFDFLNAKHIEIEHEKIHISDNKTSLSNDIYNSLIPYFQKDVKKLEEHLGIKLPWLIERT